MFGKKQSKSDKLNELLNKTLFTWPNHPNDKWTVRDSLMGVQVFGSTGSGKSSSSGKLLAKSFIENGYGGLVMVVKADEAAYWRKLRDQSNRKEDFVFFNRESGLQFNPLAYEMGRSVDGSGDTINLLQLIMVIYEMSKGFMAGGNGGNGDERFWDLALKRCLSSTLDLLILSNEEVTFQNIREIVASAPHENLADRFKALLDEIGDTDLSETDRKEAYNQLLDLRASNYCFDCLIKCIQTEDFDEDEKDRFKIASDYFTRDFANLSEKTRSIIEESVLGLLMNFDNGILKKHFSTNVSSELLPERSFEEGKIYVLDFSVKQHMLSGLLSQVIYSYIWKQAIERRKVEEESNPHPVFYWCDESQFFVSEYDALFATTARSSLCSIVFLTQNISNYIGNMKGRNAETQAKSLLANLSTMIFHAQSNFDTNQFAANQIGKVFKEMKSVSGKAMEGLSSSYSHALHYQVEPREFTTLEQGGNVKNGYKAEAFVMQTGRTWSDGKNYAKVKFSQQ